METIIQQIALDLAKNISKKAMDCGLSNIDALASDVLNDCKTAARQMLEAFSQELNCQIREDKAGRKALGLVLHEKNRSRSLFTELGTMHLDRDYYWDKHCGGYVYPLDEITGIAKYERIGGQVSAALVNEAAEVSYAKSAQIVTQGAVSRQTVRNHILKLSVPEKHLGSEEKRLVKELHVFADEDHVHMQKPSKEKGKAGKLVPLVTVTEGITTAGGRNRTVYPVHFVDEKFKAAEVWKSVSGYISKAYDTENLEKIYVHGDGANWIKKGLDDFAQTEHVLDEFHLEKYLRKVIAMFPKKNLRNRFERAFQGNDRKKADALLQELMAEAEDEKIEKKVKEFGSYILNNWDEIIRRKTLDIPGSCTEGQVSHVLSERFSRDPIGWSEDALGKLTKVRVYIKNGCKIEAKDFEKKVKEPEKYSDYAERLIRETITEKYNWDLFEKPIYTFDGSSGTQTLLKGLGTVRDTLRC